MEEPQPLPTPAPQPASAPVIDPLSDADSRTWSALAHASGILLGFVGPLIVWLIFKDRSKFVDTEAKEALNFQITLFIFYGVAGFLVILVIGLLLLPAVWLFSVIMSILAAVKASGGEHYRYPLTIRLIN